MDTSNSGGVAAKLGFLYQDCAAALYVTEMLLDKTIQAVRCEVTDDIDIIYSEYIEYVQVKTTDKLRWTVVSVTEKTRGADKKFIADSSMVHKSMKCDAPGQKKSKFRMVSPNVTKSPLDYLEIDVCRRKDKPGKDELIAELEKKLTNYQSPTGLTIEQWVEKCWWQVIPSLREIELTAMQNIRSAALNIFGIVISNDSIVESIWVNILNTMTKKSTLDRRVFNEDDKTYFRSHFIEWLKQELLFYDSKNYHAKVYVHRKIPGILVPLQGPFKSQFSTRNGSAVYQRYNLGAYRYEYIASKICEWIDELLLRPSEIADYYSSSVSEKFKLLRSRLLSKFDDLENFIANALLHSLIRTSHASQPIPATLYVDTKNSLKVYENVHIVQRTNGIDELWLGISKLTRSSSLSVILTDMRQCLYDDILNGFDQVREKILDIKEDSYLLKHDIDEILDPTNSFEDNLHRFRFIVFLGYESSLLTVPETRGYEPTLYDEASRLFDDFISDLQVSTPFSNLNVKLYLFPIPSFDDLCTLLQNKLQETK